MEDTGKRPIEIWRDLRRHLDWTQGAPSLVFLLGEQGVIADLRERVTLWSR